MDDKENLIEQHVRANGHSAAASADKPELKWTGCRYSRKAFRFRYFCLLLLTLLCLAGAIVIGPKWGFVARFGLWLALPAFLWVWLLFIAWYRHLTIQYILEEDRLICKKGLLQQTTDTILVAQINDVQMKRMLWDQVFNGGVGVIVMHTTDTTDPVLYLRGVDKPQDAFDAIDYLRKEYVRKRGIKSFGTTMIEESGLN